MEPLLKSVEALADPGCYALVFVLDTGEERSAVLRLRNGEAELPAANVATGWTEDTKSYAAVVSAVQALHEARALISAEPVALHDIDGGWDVGLGNVVLVDGTPSCVGHGPMAQTDPGIYRCETCGAAAGYRN